MTCKCEGTTPRWQLCKLCSSKKQGAPLLAAAAGPLALRAGYCVGAALGLGDGQRLQYRLCTPAQHAERQRMRLMAPHLLPARGVHMPKHGQSLHDICKHCVDMPTSCIILVHCKTGNGVLNKQQSAQSTSRARMPRQHCGNSGPARNITEGGRAWPSDSHRPRRCARLRRAGRRAGRAARCGACRPCPAAACSGRRTCTARR